jgi:mitochondrial fission protein ELM1
MRNSLESETNDAPVWVLLGKWHGDNQQLLAIAEALKLPFRVVPLRFNAASLLPPLLLGPSRLSWRSDAPLSPPWPRVVLGAGRRGVPAARWIQRQSAGHTRLISVNRPWSPMSWFDLIITTPQYALPARPHVLSNLMPFLPPAAHVSPASALPDAASTLPRPWTVVLVGGNSQPMKLCDAAAASLAVMVNEQVRSAGGSAWIVDSPRTPASAMAVIQQGLDVPFTTVSWRDGKPLYRALLNSGDRFIVTEDSASMVTEALLTGRPVSLGKLSRRPGWIRRAATAWRLAAERAPASIVGRGFEMAVASGLLAAARDLGLLHRELEKAGMFNGTGRPQELAELERGVTLSRIHALIDGS